MQARPLCTRNCLPTSRLQAGRGSWLKMQDSTSSQSSTRHCNSHIIAPGRAAANPTAEHHNNQAFMMASSCMWRTLGRPKVQSRSGKVGIRIGSGATWIQMKAAPSAWRTKTRACAALLQLLGSWRVGTLGRASPRWRNGVNSVPQLCNTTPDCNTPNALPAPHRRCVRAGPRTRSPNAALKGCANPDFDAASVTAK